MHHWLPSVVLFLLSLVVLVEFRAAAGRATLGVTRILLFFSLGAAGSSIVTLVFQRFALGLFDPTTVTWAYGPAIEEIAKAVPVAALAYLFAERRRLSVADYAILAFATGLGFAFAEANLSTLVTGTFPEHPHWWLPTLGSPAVAHSGESHWSAGHAFWAGLTGLGIGLGVRLWPRSLLRFVPAAAFFSAALFEHMVYNWKLTHLTSLMDGSIDSFARANGAVEWLSSVDLNGRLSLVALPLLVVAAAVAEGIWVRRAAEVPAQLMLPDEGVQPLVLMEWVALWRAALRGRHELVRTSRYLRRRRELVLSIAELRRHPADEALQRSVAYLRDRVVHEREELAVPLERRWLPLVGATRPSAAATMRAYWPLLAAYALVLLRFAISPRTSGVTHLSGHGFALVLMAIAAGFFVWRVRRFRRTPRPALVSSDGEGLVSYHARMLLLGTSAITLGLSVVVWFLAEHTVAPGSSAFITSYFDDWSSAAGGGSGAAAGLAALASLTSAALADVVPHDDCAPLASEAVSADARIAALESYVAEPKAIA